MSRPQRVEARAVRSIVDDEAERELVRLRARWRAIWYARILSPVCGGYGMRWASIRMRIDSGKVRARDPRTAPARRRERGGRVPRSRASARAGRRPRPRNSWSARRRRPRPPSSARRDALASSSDTRAAQPVGASSTRRSRPARTPSPSVASVVLITGSPEHIASRMLVCSSPSAASGATPSVARWRKGRMSSMELATSTPSMRASPWAEGTSSLPTTRKRAAGSRRRTAGTTVRKKSAAAATCRSD